MLSRPLTVIVVAREIPIASPVTAAIMTMMTRAARSNSPLEGC